MSWYGSLWARNDERSDSRMQGLKKWIVLICIVSAVCMYDAASAAKAEYVDPLTGPESSTTYDDMMLQSATIYTCRRIQDVHELSSERYWQRWPNRNDKNLRKSLEDGLVDIKGNVRPRLLQNALKSMQQKNYLEAFAMSDAVLLDQEMMKETDGFWKQRLLILTSDSFKSFSEKKKPIELYNNILHFQEKYIPSIMQDIRRQSNLLEDLAQRYSEAGNERNALALRELRVKILEGDKEEELYLDALNQLAMTCIKFEQYEEARNLAQKVLALQPARKSKRIDILKTRAEILLLRIAVESKDENAMAYFIKNPIMSADALGQWLQDKKAIPQDGEERLNVQNYLFLYANSLLLSKNYESAVGYMISGEKLGTFYIDSSLHPIDYYDPALPFTRRMAIFRELKSAQLENLALMGFYLSQGSNYADALDLFIQCSYWQWVLDYNRDCFETWRGMLSLSSECRNAGMFPEAKALLQYGHQRAFDELGPRHSLTVAFEKEQSQLETWQSAPSLLKSVPSINHIQFEKLLDAMWDSFEEYPLEVRKRAFAWMLPIHKMKIERLLSTGTQKEEVFQTAEMCKSQLVLSMLVRGANCTDELTADEKKELHERRRNLFEAASLSYRQSESYRFLEGQSEVGAYVRGYAAPLYFCYHQTLSRIKEYKAFCQEMAEKYSSWNQPLTYSQLTLSEGLEFLPENAAYINFLQMESNRIFAVILDKTYGFQTVEYELPWDLSSKCVDYHQLISFPDLLEVQQGKKFLWRLPDQTFQARGAGENPSGGVPATLEEYKQVREELAVELGMALLAPLHPYVSESTSHLIISPDNSLAMIPFESLIYQGKPLVASFDISYLQSLSVGKFLKERQTLQSRSGEKKLFAIGNPNYERRIIDKKDKEYFPLFDDTAEWSKEWSRVPNVLSLKEWKNLGGTETEIAAVAGCFDYHDLLTGGKATKRHLFALNEEEGLTQYSHILFAVHGAVMPDCPDYPVLVLGRDDYNVLERSGNGILDVFDVMQLNLNSDLVYLSACETGLGEYVTGEGIFGLPLAFNVAGNRDTVMSLWKIDDGAAAVFSGKFFQQLSEGIPPAKALSAIKREWLQNPDGEYADPYFWTPMILYGVP